MILLQVAKNISAALHDRYLFACHSNISFSLFNRSSIKSISDLAVLIPLVDFFWNACTTQMSSPTTYTTRNASPRNAKAISNTPEPSPRIGLAMSDLLPSAAIVKAVRHVDFTALGKVSNSLSAALTHEIGRVVLVISEPLLVTSWPTRARPCCHN